MTRRRPVPEPAARYGEGPAFGGERGSFRMSAPKSPREVGTWGAGVPHFLGGTAGMPRNGSRSAPKASAGTAGATGRTGSIRR